MREESLEQLLVYTHVYDRVVVGCCLSSRPGRTRAPFRITK